MCARFYIRASLPEKMGCGAKCIKVILKLVYLTTILEAFILIMRIILSLQTVLIVVNILFFLAGLGLLGVGIWMRVDSTLERFNGAGTSLEDFRTALYTSAYILIAFGSFTVVVAFCGCCGAIKESKVRQGAN